MQGKRDEYGLTPKQRKFSENIVSGMNLSDAYRNAYDAGGMTSAQIHREASLLGSDPKVTQCVEALGAELRRKGEALTVSDRDKVVTKLRDWLDGKESHNRNTFGRCVYIHGTPEEWRLGTPASYGCIRMGSRDVADLFKRIGTGADVFVIRNSIEIDPPSQASAGVSKVSARSRS